LADAPYDEQTIAFYDREAAAYAASGRRSRHIDGFIARVGAGAKVLELGCGGGHDAEAMLAAGIDVTPTDASAELANLASQRVGAPVRVMRFDELSEVDAFDGVWANACLLHVPAEALADVLAKIFRSLRNGGVFCASFKGGEGGDRDKLGRYYNFPSRADLERCYAAGGPWSALAIDEGVGGGYDGVARTWYYCTAVK
jgi:SAM-dependent methyltransferase